MELNNKSEHEFTDISSERWRQYHYADGNPLVIQWPVSLSVSESGGHRILDSSGISYYIKPEWRHITWKAKDAQPHFVK